MTTGIKVYFIHRHGYHSYRHTMVVMQVGITDGFDICHLDIRNPILLDNLTISIEKFL